MVCNSEHIGCYNHCGILDIDVEGSGLFDVMIESVDGIYKKILQHPIQIDLSSLNECKEYQVSISQNGDLVPILYNNSSFDSITFKTIV